MSGVEEGGGEPSSGIPPTKKAPTLYQHRSLHGSFKFRPPTSSAAGVDRTPVIILPRRTKASGTFSKITFFLPDAQPDPRQEVTIRPRKICAFITHAPADSPAAAASPARRSPECRGI